MRKQADQKGLPRDASRFQITDYSVFFIALHHRTQKPYDLAVSLLRGSLPNNVITTFFNSRFDNCFSSALNFA